jgi:hypothetical protein
LDAQTLQLTFVRLPTLGTTAPLPDTFGQASYKAAVEREMDKVEALLKVVGTPVDAIIPTFTALIAESTIFEFQKILELKVKPISRHTLNTLY